MYHQLQNNLKMHIAYITAEYPHDKLKHAGGIGSLVKTISHSLVNKGHLVTVFLCLTEKEDVWNDGKVQIVQIKRSNVQKIGAIIDRLKINKVVNKYVKSHNIDLIEAPDWEGLHAYLNVRIPLITRINGSVTYFSNIEKRSMPKVMKYFEAKAIKRSNSVVSASKFAAKESGDLFGLDSTKFKIIYNGVDVDKFIPEKETLNDNNTILYFGTLIRKKGVLEIPHIFNELIRLNNRPELVLIGKDAKDPLTGKSTWQMMKELFSEQALEKVKYLGPIAYENIATYIQKSKVCIFPSYAEAFPISWLEAMAMEKAIVASSIGWSSESIENGVSGYLVYPNHYRKYAEKINNLLSQPDLRKGIAKNARLRVETYFNQNILVERSIEFYRQQINK